MLSNTAEADLSEYRTLEQGISIGEVLTNFLVWDYFKKDCY